MSPFVFSTDDIYYIFVSLERRHSSASSGIVLTYRDFVLIDPKVGPFMGCLLMKCKMRVGNDMSELRRCFYADLVS